MVANRAIFRPSGWEEDRPKKRLPSAPEPTPEDEKIERSKRRARVALYDYAMATPFRYFVTLTLDAQRVDRYDMAAITKRINVWLGNQVRRSGLSYVLVPEYHKDGAIHFHGFINDALRVLDSGHKDTGGHAVYNVLSWPFGYSTAIELYGDRSSAVGYCCKYITKAQQKIGGRWYYSGGKLQKPDVQLCNVEYDDYCEGYIFRPPSMAGVEIAILKSGRREETHG